MHAADCLQYIYVYIHFNYNCNHIVARIKVPYFPLMPDSSARVLIIVYINVVLYATCYQLQRPIEPFMVEKLGLNGDGDSAGEYARLQSFFSIIQMVGSFFYGILLDRLGSRGGFMLSFFSSGLCYAMLANADSLSMLYLSKIPTIFQAGFLCAQAAIAESTPDGADRVSALGRLTVAYTIGSVIGPVLGGLLGSSGDYYFGAKLAVAGSALSMALTLFMPAGSHKKPVSTVGEPSASTPRRDVTVWSVVSAVWVLLSTKVITSVANSMAAATMPLILKNVYGLHEASMGLAMSVMSGCNALTNGFLLSPIVKLHKDDIVVVVKKCNIGMTVLYFLQLGATFIDPKGTMALFGGYNSFMLTTVLLSMHQYILSTTITAEATARVDEDGKGTLLGLEHSLFAGARILSPQIGIFILQSYGIAGVSCACGTVFLAVSAFYSFAPQTIFASPPHGEIEEKKSN